MDRATTTQPAPRDRNEIVDGMRGLAILWIAAYHIWQLSWLEPSLTLFGFKLDFQFLVRDGHLGVELFVFLSGFSLFYPFARGIFTGARIPAWAGFYKKRALRIFPSYCLTLLIALLFFNEGITSLPDILRHTVTHLLFIHTMFNDTYGSILGPLWMMGLIVQFYYLFPLLCKAFSKKPLLTFGLLSVLCLVYRLMVIHYWPYNTTMLISILPAFLDVFLFGMAAAYVVCYLKQYTEHLARIKAVSTLAAVLSLVVFAALVHNSYYYILSVKNGYGVWQSTNRFFLSLDFFLFTVSATFAYKGFRILFANPLTTFLAAISYNLYFWHQQIARLFYDNRLIPAAGIITTADQQRLDHNWQIWFTVVVYAVSLAAAVLLTYGFEKPVSRWLPLAWKKARELRLRER